MRRFTSVVLIGLTVCSLVLGCGLLTAKGDEPVAALSVGKSYTVSYESPIENAFPKKAYKAEKKLTDGKFASQASYTDPAFTEFYRGTVLYVTIDLESVCAVERVEVHGLGNKGAGIYAPRRIAVAVSEDGKSFGTVAELEDKKANQSGSAKLVNTVLELPKAYKARYVRVAVHCDVFLYLDEMTVFGQADASSAASAAADSPAEERGFASTIDGVRNICLMYTVGHYKEDHLLPYLAYVDEKGYPTDTLYDGMLFLPSGASGFDFSDPDGWNAYFDDLFGEETGTNLTALNRSIGLYGFELGLPEGFRYPVFLAVPKLKEGTEEFDGLLPLNLDNKTVILKSMIDRMIKRFEESGFDNLELKGFYWHEELIPYAEYDYAEELAKAFTSYVHEKGYKSLWIPYYCASGFERAGDLGFDGACLQSGYAFDHSKSETGDSLAAACEDSAKQAKKYGLGIEFELDLNAPNFRKRFFKYVHTAYSTGCMTDGLMAMYQGVFDIYQCARAEAGSDKREVYELLYKYISGSFTSVPPVLEPGQVILAETGEKISGNLKVTDPDSAKNALKIKDRKVQEGLTAVFEGDGFYLVNTKDTVPGTYLVTLTLTDGYNVAEPQNVEVVVYDKEAERTSVTLERDLSVYADLEKRETVKTLAKGESVTCLPVRGKAYYVFDGEGAVGIAFADELGLPDADPVSTEESIPAQEPGKGVPWPVWAGIGAAALAAAAVAAILVIRKKKKKKT